MHLNIMMTFAQFEREVIGERIRDKVAASRKKGMWMGGWAPFGYQVKDRKLVVNAADAATVRSIFKRFLVLKSATLLAHELRQKDVRNRYGQAIDKGVRWWPSTECQPCQPAATSANKRLRAGRSIVPPETPPSS
jgi:site-specific DNA recombinase